MDRRVGYGAIAGLVVAIVAAGLITFTPWSDDDPGDCRIASADALDETVVDGVAWLDRSVQPDGSFWYEYDRTIDEFSDDYNHVRHAGTLMALMHVAADGGESADEALAAGDQGLEFVFDQTVVSGDRAAFDEPGRSFRLGSTALVVVALVHRRIATGDDQYDDMIRDMGRFMLSLQREDGAMWAEATGPDLEPRVGVTSTFYTGESFYALGALANLFPGEGWEEATEAVGHYIATARDEEEEIENPPLADQWSAYGFSEMREWDALEGDELAYVRSLIEKFNSRMDTEIGREANRVGDGSADPDETVRQSRGAGFGTSVEALGALWRLSVVDPGLADLEDQLLGDLRCGASILEARQYSAERAAPFERPEIVEGAWFYQDDDRDDHFLTRVDDQQHAISGVVRAVPAFSG